jgi:hypothetical protein
MVVWTQEIQKKLVRGLQMNKHESICVLLAPDIMKALAHMAIDRDISKSKLASEIIEMYIKLNGRKDY